MSRFRSKNQVKHFWFYLLAGTLMTLLLYLTMTSTQASTLAQMQSHLPFIDQTQETLLSSLAIWYTVETALLRLFPKETYVTLANLDVNANNQEKLQQQQEQHSIKSTWLSTLFTSQQIKPPMAFSWSKYYHLLKQLDLSPSFSSSSAGYRCEDQPLPYPILRHLVKQVLQLDNDTTTTMALENYDRMLLPDLTAPFLLLPFDPQANHHDHHDHRKSTPFCVRAVIPPSVLKQPNTPFHYRYEPYKAWKDTASMLTTSTPSIATTATATATSSPWWDMMQVSARHLLSNATVAIDMQPWAGYHTLYEGYQKKWYEDASNVPGWSRQMIQDMDERGWLHVYEANVALLDPGRYTFEAKLEYQDAYWNTDLGPVQAYTPINLAVQPSAQLTIRSDDDDDDDDNHSHGSSENENDDVHDSMHSLKRMVLDHLELPLCQGGRADYHGRWLPWPFNDVLQDASKMVTGLDRHGKFWAPYTCRYRPLSHGQFQRCLARKYTKGLNIYGDSNMRRSIKSFLSHGQWCQHYERYINITNKNDKNNSNQGSDSTRTQNITFETPQQWAYLGDPRQLRACQCEDFQEATWNPAWFNATARRWNMTFENSIETSQQLEQNTEWDTPNSSRSQRDGISVHSYKWDGLTYMNDPSWENAFTNTVYRLPTNVDLVIISLVNWDMAYMQLATFQQQLTLLIQYLQQQYNNNNNNDNTDSPPLIIYRTPQYYCCRVDHTSRQRKSNTARMKMFDHVAQQLFRTAFADRLMIWDTMMMGERRTWDEKVQGSTCGANHAPADVIHLENQVLMNGLCNSFN